MKTFSAKPSDVKREWFVVDAAGVPLGRLASKVAHILRGKHKAMFTPHIDTGDYVIIVNAAKVGLTGRKAETKTYYRYSGYPGGLKEISFKKAIQTKPEWVIEKAVKGMLPKNRLGDAMFKKLKVYAGPNHKHEAQSPQELKMVEGA
ncbi:MAG: 50S ribosomal protein L13 [Candidatus Aquicultorales bacterium]